jgi:membrane-bound inhibitor of C-type lysozyme
MKNYFGIVIIILLLAGAGIYVFNHTYSERTHNVGNIAPVSSVSFLCASNKTLVATYEEMKVSLALSDGRTIALTQVMSGSGFRYRSSNPEVAFIGKGSNAYLEENNITTYANCVTNLAPVTGNATPNPASSYTFSDNGKTFKFNYPKEVTVSGGGIGYSTAWQNQATTSGLVLVQVILPGLFQPKTNFGDAKFTVGTSADSSAVATCLVGPSGIGIRKSAVTINSQGYTKITYVGVGAGNLYETTSYRTIRNNQCYTFEYVIHSSNIGNYDPSQGISPYDKTAVIGIMESIVQSVTFL